MMSPNKEKGGLFFSPGGLGGWKEGGSREGWGHPGSELNGAGQGIGKGCD